MHSSSLMVSLSDSGRSSLGSSPCRDNCAAFLDNKLHSYSNCQGNLANLWWYYSMDCILERFSIECCKTKTKTKPITNQLDYSANVKLY